MYSDQLRSAIVLLISLATTTGGAAAAEADSAPAPTRVQLAQTSPAAPANAAPAEAEVSVPSLKVPVLGGDASTAAGQRSASAGYELAGSGIGSRAEGPTETILTAPTKGRAIRFDNGIFVYPSAMLAVGHNDNVTGSNTNTTSSQIVVLRPEVVAELKRNGDRYSLSYAGNYGHYTNSSADDFDHHDFWFGGDNYFTARARMGWGVGYLLRSDARGSTDRAAATSEPDRWRAPVARFIGIYGAPGARGRIEVEADAMQKRYQNNRASTIGSDVDMLTLAGRFAFRVMPRTSLLFEARQTRSDYLWSASTSDNDYRKLLLGVTWEASAKTTGFIKLGRATKDFDLGGRKDPSAGTWEAGVTWSPLTYSVFNLQTAQDIADSTGFGNFVDNRSVSLTWDHNWSSYFSSSLNLSQVSSDYDGADRNDKTRNYGIGVYREVGHNFRLGVSHNRTERDSNVPAFDFKRNVTMISLEMIL